MLKKQPPLIIERLEEDQAIIRFNGQTFSLPRALLPRAAQAGDAIRLAVALLPSADFRYGKAAGPRGQSLGFKRPGPEQP